MNLEAISVAASIALVSTFVFLLVAKSWHAITRSVGSVGSFRGSIMVEAAQRFGTRWIDLHDGCMSI